MLATGKPYGHLTTVKLRTLSLPPRASLYTKAP